MKSYAEKVVPEKYLNLFRRIEIVLQRMPEIDLGEAGSISCHIICAALADLFPVSHRSGYFGGLNEHSWLVMGSLIIDAYPVAVVGGPILVDARYITGWSNLYKEAYLPVLSKTSFLASVKIVKEVMEQVVAESKARPKV